MRRANRLSRSRDFDAVYRQGRSVSTRFLTLYWFPTETAAPARLGLAVPRTVGNAVARSRIKRQLREIWRTRAVGQPTSCDYVLVVRPGLPEAADSRGAPWLAERVEEVLGKAGA